MWSEHDSWKATAQKIGCKMVCIKWLTKAKNAEGTKKKNSEEIIDFSVKSLFMHFNAENYISKH